MADDDGIPNEDPGRRRFLKIATCAIGGGLGAVVAVPAIRFLLDPVGREVVTTGGAPIDVLGLDQLAVDAAPVQVRVVARSIRDAWSTITEVPLGSAWLRRLKGDQLQALSAVCPHLGCSVAFDPKAGGDGKFRCPCHDSAFAPSGERLTGPAERGLDELPWAIEDGRIKLTWIRYRQGGGGKTPT